ncbi:hypothetical protein RXV95_06130 [Novosphingobium sp. ZN18A2]|uniref:hypothetical protein n=1 Tax=Novosphingobium sp. ZN18A2 TaxID=3079861 RepID=UPI0030CAA144
MSFAASRFSRAIALAVSASLVSAPALAAPIPAVPLHRAVSVDGAVWTPQSETVWHRRWHRRGWHHRDGLDGGDVLAGILLIGGIAAIASAASKSDSNRAEDRYRDPPPPQPVAPQEQGYAAPQPQAQPGPDMGAGADMADLDRAADACVDAVAGRGDVDHVYTVDPSSDGFRVSGDFTTGAPFSCKVSAGRVDSVFYGNTSPRAVESPVRPAPEAGDRNPPADDGAPAQDDGRYNAADAPDFQQSPAI